MEAGGFRVRLDLSQFFSDIRKFSCIYVDVARDRQIADVVDRISDVFEIDRPLFLLDERFYLPESENVNVLLNSNIVKVLKAFHSKDNESCSTPDHITKSSKGVAYVRQEIHPEQVSIKSNKTDISENSSSHDLYENEKVDSSSVSHTDKEVFHELRGKKRKHEKYDKSKCTNDVNILQQDVEPEIHYQKKCKRKKEKVKKEFLNGSTLEPDGDDLEGRNNDSIHFGRKKKRNKAEQIKGDDVEDNDVSEVQNLVSLENITDHNEQATCDSRELKKHKKNRKEGLTSLDTHKIIELEPLQSADLKKRKKKLSQNDTDTGGAQDESVPLSYEKNGMTFLTRCSQGTQKYKTESKLICQNNDGVANSYSIEKHGSTEYEDSDFAHGAISSTPTFTHASKVGEVAGFLLQENTNTHDSTLSNNLENETNTVISIKPKRKRVRVRKHKKRNRIEIDSVVSLPSVRPLPPVLQSSVPPRKHIRFEEEMTEKLKEDTSQHEVALENITDIRNNTTEEACDSKASPNVNVECTHKLTAENEATDCIMKDSFENSVPENLTYKNSTTSLSHQIPVHQQWALNTANMNMDSKESLQKLLTLGKQSSVPVVFERKSQFNTSGSASESSTLASKQNINSKTPEGTYFQKQESGMTCLKTDPNAINPLNYPQLEGKPKQNDLIAFKMLKLTSNYTPEVSDFIIATVLSICEDTSEMTLQIEVGASDLEAPKGRFSIENDDTEKTENDSKLRQLNWNELMDVRILFP